VLGAGHERGLRPGTENVPHIVGLGQACELAQRDLDSEPARQRTLREELWNRLVQAIPECRRNGHPTEGLPNTLNLSFPVALGSAVLRAAPEVAASTGSACHEGGETASPVLLAMGIDAKVALGAVRLSLGRSTTREQILAAADALIAAHQKLA
jgi:cysteine desulfurase